MPYPKQAAAELRLRYLSEAIDTAAPAVRLTMLVDRLEMDLRAADAGFAEGDLKKVSDGLVHAQEIVLTLRDSLRIDQWEGAPRLHGLYTHLYNELVGANLTKDRERAAAAAVLLGQIAQAWRDAAILNQKMLEPVGGVG
ncbi:flagellar protein FliS [Acidiferrimicrobium sp. IK]|uniref:flagellar export chaperone FliS n=1 Tax=Acidiferrimicrobium sp. IK TaxID=2871700 RepID=UPI0021CAF93C|nr:flagellar export chaperone FliS [Acidiferrimicrobium sp. IK]MCU4185023.1 flagellar protein FliS [Acidiferrimicrobium sp. IK]